MTSMQELSVQPPGVDEQLTAERHEIKYLVPPDLLNSLVATLDQRIGSHRFHGEGANQLPYAQHFVTTVYLDTPSRAHYRAAVDDTERNVKVRVREYYDVHPSLAELATEREQILHHQPWIWLEVKRREGSRTRKRRARLPKREVPKLFSGGLESLDALSAQDSSLEYAPALKEIAEYCQSIGETLAPTCVSNCQRLSWQLPESHLRLTLDLDVSFFAPRADLWERDQVLVRELLGEEMGRTEVGVLEVKYCNKLPGWLEQSLQQANLRPTGHSKFVLGSGAVYGL